MPPKINNFPSQDASPQEIETWKLHYFSAYNNGRKRQHQANEADEVANKRNANLQEMIRQMEVDPGYTGYQNAAKVRLENTANTKGTRPFLQVADTYAKILQTRLAFNPFFKSLQDLKGEAVTNAEMCKHWNLNKCSASGSHYPKTTGGLGLSRIHGCVICFLATGAIFGHKAIECKLLRDLDKVHRHEAKIKAQRQRKQDAKKLATNPATTPGNAGNTTKRTPSPPLFNLNDQETPAGTNSDPVNLEADIDAEQLAHQMDNTSMS